MSVIGRAATPESAAALATAGAIFIIRRGSNGLGIRYSGPNAQVGARVGGGHHLALLGLGQVGDRVHGGDFHLASLMVVAPQSSAPRKMYGKHRTLLTWFG